MISFALALTLLAAPVAPVAAAKSAPKKVTLIFTGDNGGEVAPCG